MFRSDAHKILGTTDQMSDEEIKKRYQKLRSLYHPDKNPGNEAESKKKFEAVQEAKDVLDGKVKQPPPNSGFRQQPGGFSTHYVNPEDLAEFLKNFQQAFHPGPDNRPRPDKIDDYQDSWGSSGPGARSHGPQVQQLNAVIVISLEEAFNGCTKEINIPVPGALAAQEPHKVVIPRGASESDVVAVIEKPTLTIRCFIRIAPSEYKVQFASPFNVNGAGNVIREQKVSPFLMMTGGFMEVKTLDGTINVRVPEGLEANMMLKVQGKGYWKGFRSTERGDMFLRMVPDIKPIKDIPLAEYARFTQVVDEYRKGQKVDEKV